MVTLYWYRVSNKIVVKNRYTILWIVDLVNQHKSAKYFSNIDMTTFKSKEGPFDWLVMPFVLLMPQQMFVGMMNDIL